MCTASVWRYNTNNICLTKQLRIVLQAGGCCFSHPSNQLLLEQAAIKTHSLKHHMNTYRLSQYSRSLTLFCRAVRVLAADANTRRTDGVLNSPRRDASPAGRSLVSGHRRSVAADPPPCGQSRGDIQQQVHFP